MHFKTPVVFVIFILILGATTYADDGEEFKNICLTLAGDFTELMSFEDTAVPPEINKRIENSFILQPKRLKHFIEANPKSIWADDAQYILATLKAGYPEQEANELEYLLENYPNMAFEEWTKTTLPWLIPSDFHMAVRFTLLFHYKKTGEKDKLNALYDESIKRFPEKTEQFKKIINYKK